MRKRTGSVIAAIGLIIGGMLGATSVSQADPVPPTPDPTSCPVLEWKNALRYQQQAAEANALRIQSYEVATRNLDQIVKKYRGKHKHLAVMTDLDETAIDNTELLVRDMEACHQYDTWDTWSDWERNGDPTAIPGAVRFFKHADRLGVKIFYVSDRTDANKAYTLATLKKLGFPKVNNNTVRLLGPSKAVRRAAIRADHKLVMQLGDSLPDFDGDFASADNAARQGLVKKYARHFGQDWIVLPNSSYGSKWKSVELKAWSKKELVIE